jgi:hypothetical protein
VGEGEGKRKRARKREIGGGRERGREHERELGWDRRGNGRGGWDVRYTDTAESERASIGQLFD